jgi:predicted RNase H-related nuclease YkuK (DUF458 family)
LGHELVVSVGTDSQRNGRGYKAATVILIHTKEDLGGGTVVGRGGKMIISEYPLPVYKKGKEGVNDRMMSEVAKSMEVAYEIAPLLNEYGVKMEIHADINPNPKWESNKALSAAVGWILGMGYEFKIKPEAVAASNCSDKHAK